MTNEQLLPYVAPLAAVMRTLGHVKQTMTYGDAAKIVGVWTTQTHYPKEFDTRLINLTADALNEHSQESWQWLVNAETGKPGSGFYPRGVA
jgi:hypothetical protein